MHYIYVLKSNKDGLLYVGYTNDLVKRFKEHNTGKTRSTKNRAPFALVYYEAYKDKTDARKREISLKKNHYQKEQLVKNLENSLEG